MAIEEITIVPPGAKLKINENTIPLITDATAIEIAINVVFLKPFPNIIALMFGITINEEIRRTPTRRTDTITAKLARTINR